MGSSGGRESHAVACCSPHAWWRGRMKKNLFPCLPGGDLDSGHARVPYMPAHLASLPQTFPAGGGRHTLEMGIYLPHKNLPFLSWLSLGRRRKTCTPPFSTFLYSFYFAFCLLCFSFFFFFFFLFILEESCTRHCLWSAGLGMALGTAALHGTWHEAARSHCRQRGISLPFASWHGWLAMPPATIPGNVNSTFWPGGA